MAAGGVLDVPLAQLVGARFVGDGDLEVAVDRDRLEPLGAHDRAHAAAAPGAALVVDDAGDACQLLPRLADGGDLGHAAVALLEDVLYLVGVLAPEVGGVEQAGLAVLDIEVDRAFGAAGEEKAVVAGELGVGPHGAATVGITPGVGERRLADEDRAVALDGGGAGERAGEEAEDVLGAERVDAGPEHAVQEARAHAVATDEVAADLVGELLDAQRAARQVHVQHLAHVAARHAQLLSRARCGPTARSKRLHLACALPPA